MKRIHLFILTGLLMAGIIFSIIQVTRAEITGPHNPGHLWSQLDKPADCSTGQYIYGANDSGWLCSAPSSGGGGTLVQTTVSGYVYSSDGSVTTEVLCPDGYIRTGCSSYWRTQDGMEDAQAKPYLTNGCTCYIHSLASDDSVSLYCYAYCIKLE